jgi:uncharacterized membrane protein
MSLKLFHVVFVTCSTLLAFLFGGWSLARGGGYAIGGVAAFAVGAALAVYGVWFWRKIQTPEEERRRKRKLFRTVGALAVVWLLGAAREASACSVCYGEAEGPMMDAAKLGVWLLYGLVLAVQLALLTFFLHLRRRSRNFHGPMEPWWTDVKEAREP